LSKTITTCGGEFDDLVFTEMNFNQYEKNSLISFEKYFFHNSLWNGYIPLEKVTYISLNAQIWDYFIMKNIDTLLDLQDRI
jgi:hypothetical protein